MGITLNQLDQFAGGAVEGYTESQANRRFNDKNEREQADADREATKFKQQQDAGKIEADRVQRVAMQEAYQQVNTSEMQDRARIDEKWAATGQQGPSGPTMYGAPNVSVAATPGAPNIQPPTVPQLAGGVGALPEVPVAKAADGGQVHVGPPAQGLPVQQPPQQQPPQQQPPAQGLPTEPEQPAYKTRRQEYQAWYKKASAAHALAGGLEGLTAFRKQEDALSRKQMLGYGTKGVTAMRDGNAGDAVRQLNTMLDVSPEDSGMRWEAFDGKVYLVGSDGNKGNPYDQAAVMSLIENKIKTPETYLQFQAEARNQGIADEGVRSAKEDERQARREQTEKERGALEEEEQGRTGLGIDQQEADATTLTAETDAAESPSRIEKNIALSYYYYASGFDEMYGGGSGDGAGGPEDWWAKRGSNDIEKIGEYAQKGLLGFDQQSPWAFENAVNSELYSSTVGATKSIRFINNPYPTKNNPNPIVDDDAADIARMAYFNDLTLEDGQDIEDYIPTNLAETKVFYDDVTGGWKVEYKGKQVLVPPDVGERIKDNKQKYFKAKK